jgi:hypothetical protein
LVDQHPVILVRETSILVNITQIRAIIKNDQVLVISFSSGTSQIAPAQSDSVVIPSDFIHELQGKLQTKDTPHLELRALEAILMHAMAGTRHQLAVFLHEVEDLFGCLNQRIDTNELKKLLLLRRKVDRFHGRIDEFRVTLTELLNKLSDAITLLNVLDLTCFNKR